MEWQACDASVHSGRYGALLHGAVPRSVTLVQLEPRERLNALPCSAQSGSLTPGASRRSLLNQQEKVEPWPGSLWMSRRA